MMSYGEGQVLVIGPLFCQHSAIRPFKEYSDGARERESVARRMLKIDEMRDNIHILLTKSPLQTTTALFEPISPPTGPNHV
ncbi:hypothetical protein IAS59_001290 [Cryptococcus gattii]